MYLNTISKQTCLFNNLKMTDLTGTNNKSIRCSSDRNLDTKDRIFCDAHLRMFNLAIDNEKGILSNNNAELNFKSLIFYNTQELFLPFPFTYDKINKEFCLNVESLKKIANSNYPNIIYTQFLEALLTNGIVRDFTRYNVEPEFFNRILQKANDETYEFLKARHSSSFITLMNTDENGNITSESVSMEKLPMFYQLLFYNVRLSTLCKPDQTVLVETPNLVCDIAKQFFRVINGPHWIRNDDTTIKTPVILAGYSTDSFVLGGEGVHKFSFPPMCIEKKTGE